MKTLAKLTLASTLATALVHASDDTVEEESAVPEVFSVPSTEGAAFVETFQNDPFDGRWVKSGDDTYAGQTWDWGAPKTASGKYVADKGITATTEAKRYGLSTALETPIDSVDKDLVLQYEVRLQDGLTCGGAYLKFLNQDDNFTPATLGESSGYSVMFGPDKCGNTNQVHLILRHQNPVSGEWEEKHLKASPSPKVDSAAHLYTAILRKDKTFEILIDSVSVKSGTLVDDMVAYVDGKKKDYGFEPPKEIDDPEDFKPADWVDEAKIKDPDAFKPEDWDEDAPKQIPDMDAEKPEDWLDDAPDFVADPDAESPEDWDEEEDGEWEAPQIPNPDCKTVSGCGEWVRPIIDNPDYRGKWVHPEIDNPDYQGVWSPRQIANPAYFSAETHPEAFSTLVAPIGGVAVEIWTMQSGIHFDNIYIGNDIGAAATWAMESFGLEQEEEAAAAKAAARKAAKDARDKKWNEGGVLAKASVVVSAGLEVAGDNLIATVLTMLAVFGGLMYWMCCSGEEDDYNDYEKEFVAEAPAEEEAEETEEAEEATAAPEEPKEKAKKESTRPMPVPESKASATADKDAGSTKKKKKKKKKKKSEQEN